MNSKFYLLFLLLITCSVSVNSQSIETEFQVLEEDDEIQLPDSIQAKIEADSTALHQSLLQWYSARGFLNVNIDSVIHSFNESDSISLIKVEVDRGCQFNLNQLQVTYTGEKDTVITFSSRGEYSQALIEREIRSLIYELEEQGFPFAKAHISSFNPNYTNCNVSIALEIETGEKITSTDIYFSGAQSNSQEYLRRLSRFQNTATLTPAYLRALKSNLNSSELFNSIEDAQIFTRDGQPIIIFQVEERRLNQFDGLLGYVPNREGEGQIIGDAELSLWNVLLQGNGINFRYQRIKPERSRLNLGLSQLWIGNIPVGASAGFQLEQNDTTYQARYFSLDAFYQLISGIRITGGVEYQATTSGRNLINAVEPDGRKQIGRLGFEYSSLNNYDVPTSGLEMMINFSVANKDLEDDSSASFNQNMLNFRIRNYFPLFNRSVITPSLHVFFLDAERVTINDLITFGGTNSFRGYAEEQFRAGTMVWGDLEYRFMINQYSYLFGFVAAGGYERPRLLTEETGTFHVVDYLYSGGFGLSYRTPIGQIRFTYAVSPEESFGNGKIHFGIRTSL